MGITIKARLIRCPPRNSPPRWAKGSIRLGSALKSRANSHRAINRRQLQSIYDEIDRLEKTEVKLRRFTTYRPLFQWPLLAAFGLLSLELALSNTRFRRVP